MGNDKANWEKLAAEQDGEPFGVSAVGVFRQFDSWELGQSAKTIGLITAGCNKLIGKPETLGG